MILLTLVLLKSKEILENTKLKFDLSIKQIFNIYFYEY